MYHCWMSPDMFMNKFQPRSLRASNHVSVFYQLGYQGPFFYHRCIIKYYILEKQQQYNNTYIFCEKYQERRYFTIKSTLFSHLKLHEGYKREQFSGMFSQIESLGLLKSPAIDQKSASNLLCRQKKGKQSPSKTNNSRTRTSLTNRN